MSTNKFTQFNLLPESQMVIIIARWVLVLSGLFLVLCDTQSVSMNTIRFEIIVILLLAVSNFYLVAQVLTKKPAMNAVLYGMGILDIAVITFIIVAQKGFDSNAYTFYFPAMLAFSVVFPTVELCIFMSGTILAYGFVGLSTLQTAADFQTLIIRLLMLAAVAVCGNYFSRLEQNRHKAALQNQLAAEIRPLSPSTQPEQ
jgi:hypothetical protein